MKNSITQNEVLYQRCVDGELAEDQQLELIQQLDISPNREGWRELAIQFMEQQVFEDLFSKRHSSQSTEELPTPVSDVLSESQATRNFTKLTRPVVAVALGLLLGFNLKAFIPQQAQPQLANNQSAETVPDSVAPTFDIYEYPSEEMFYQEVMLPKDLRQQIERAGYIIERKSRSFHIPTEDGNKIIVPSDTIRVRQAIR